MFKFDFDIDDAEDGAGDLQIDQSVPVKEASTTYHENSSEEISSEFSLDELVSCFHSLHDSYLTVALVLDFCSASRNFFLSCIRSSLNGRRGSTVEERPL